MAVSGITRVGDFHAGHTSGSEFHQTFFLPNDSTVKVNDQQVVKVGDTTSCTDVTLISHFNLKNPTVTVQERPVNITGNLTTGGGHGVPSASTYGSIDVYVGATAPTIVAASMGVPQIDSVRVSNDTSEQILQGRETELNNGNDPNTMESLESIQGSVTGFDGVLNAPVHVGERDGVPFEPALFTIQSVQPELLLVEFDYELWGIDADYRGNGKGNRSILIDSDDSGKGYAAGDVVFIRGEDLNGIHLHDAIIRVDKVHSRRGSGSSRYDIGLRRNISPMTGIGCSDSGSVIIGDNINSIGETGYEVGDIIKYNVSVEFSYEEGATPEKADSDGDIYVEVTSVGANGSITGLTGSYMPGISIPPATKEETRSRDPTPDNPATETTIDVPADVSSAEVLGVTDITNRDNLHGRIHRASIMGTATAHAPNHGAQPEYIVQLDEYERPELDPEGNPIIIIGPRRIVTFTGLQGIIGDDSTNNPFASILGWRFHDHTDSRIRSELADKLGELHHKFPGNTFEVTSAYRSINLNRAVGGARNSAHLNGLAVDVTWDSIETNGLTRQAFVQECMNMGFLGFGLFPEYVHIDLKGRSIRRWGPDGSRNSLVGPYAWILDLEPEEPIEVPIDLTFSERVRRPEDHFYMWVIRGDEVATNTTELSLSYLESVNVLDEMGDYQEIKFPIPRVPTGDNGFRFAFAFHHSRPDFLDIDDNTSVYKFLSFEVGRRDNVAPAEIFDAKSTLTQSNDILLYDQTYQTWISPEFSEDAYDINITDKYFYFKVANA